MCAGATSPRRCRSARTRSTCRRRDSRRATESCFARCTGPSSHGGSMNRGTMGIAVVTLTCVASLAAVLRAHRDDDDRSGAKHVLLLSVDGLHAYDLERFVDTHPR